MAWKKQNQLKDGQTLQYNTIKVPIYPDAEQTELFEKTFGCCRYVWNQMLSDQQRFYIETGKHFIPTPAKYKNSAPFLKEVDNQALIQEYNQLSRAFSAYFKDNARFGFPKFKRKKDDRDSFTVCNHVVGSSETVYITKDAVRMTKAGLVKAKFSRRPRSGWKLKRATVEKTRSGKYFCSIIYESTVRVPEPITPTEQTTIGLKCSTRHFYVDSDGGAADPPQWMRESREKLKRIQRRLDRMETGSNNYNETLQTLRKLYEHIANQRRDYLHKESTRIANEWDCVCMRGDDLTAMARTSKFTNTLDCGFGAFREMLRYKLERQGKQLILLDRYTPTTRVCHSCGHVENAPIDHRKPKWICPSCGAELDREINGAINIKYQGLSQYFIDYAQPESA